MKETIYLLKFSIRILFKKNWGYSITSILGLAVGFASIMFAYLFTFDEFNYDKFHPESHGIYRVVVDWNGDGLIRDWARSSAPIGNQLREKVAGLEHVVRIRKNPGTQLLTIDDRSFYESDLLLVERGFFELFGFELKEGDASSVLIDPYSVVLSEEAALKYFNESNPVGKSIRYDNKFDLTITGITEKSDLPSHIDFEVLLSFDLLKEMFPQARLDHWGQFDHYTYVKLEDGVEMGRLMSDLQLYLSNNAPAWVPEKMSLGLQPIESIHLESHRESELSANSKKEYSLTLISATTLILIVALLNYINICLATYLRRQEEVSIRKVLGISKRRLFMTLISETIVLSVISMMVAIVAIEILSPEFQKLTGKSVDPYISPGFIIVVIAISIGLGIIAGVFPSLFLSGSAKTVVGSYTYKRQKKLARNAMISVQIILSATLISTILIISEQLNFLNDFSPGFEGTNVVIIPIKDRSGNESYATVAHLINNLPGVENASFSSTTPGSNNSLTYTFSFSGSERGETPMTTIIADENYIDLYKINLKEGRNLASNTEGILDVVLNESAVKFLQLNEPIGTKITGKINGEVIGIVEDFQIHSLHSGIEPLIMYLYTPTLRYVNVKFHQNPTLEIINGIEKIWKENNPEYPMEYYYLEEDNSKSYLFEEGLRTAFSYFVPVAILLAITGLIGFTLLYSAEKIFEFSIRRTFGATASAILVEVIKKIAPVTIVSGTIVVILSYWGGSKWLESFAYRTSLRFEHLVIPPLVMVILEIIIVIVFVQVRLLKPPSEVLRTN